MSHSPFSTLFWQTVATLLRNELRRYFFSPLVYLLTAVFLLMSGFFFVLTLKASQDAGMMRYVFSNTSVLLLLLSPLMTMGLIADERAQHTLPLLLSSPITAFQIVFAKFSAALTVLAFLLASTWVYPCFLYAVGQPDFWPLLTGYGGLFLMGSVFLAVGLWTSCWAKNTLVSASSAFGLSLLWWLFSSGAQTDTATQPWQPLWRYLSLGEHQDSFLQGWFSLSDTLFYLSALVILLGASVMAFQRQREHL